MLRDPFDIHRKNAFQATAFQTVQQIRTTAAHVGAAAIDMSFNIPKNVPNFGAPHRDLEDRAWAALSRGKEGASRAFTSGVQSKLSHYFDDKSLPMYKDKPYGHGYGTRRWWRRKRVPIIIVALVSLTFLWLTGFFGGSGEKRPSTSKSAWSWLGMPSIHKAADWDQRRQRVVEAFELSWDAYSRYAWGYDEYHPIAKTGRNMAPKGLGWIIIDSLDTMMLMNLTSRVEHAREWLSKSLTWDQDQDVNTFETTIRMLGGLLSAHYLSNEYPNLAPVVDDDHGKPGEDLYLEKAKDLADRLMAAFESESGVPYASVNLGKMKGLPSHADGGASSTAEATTIQLEFKYLAKLTGETNFWEKAEKVMEVVDSNGAKGGLVPIYLHPATGEFRGSNIRLGSRGDSYYEYLIKQYLQTNKQEPVYEEMWDEALEGVRRHLITYTEPTGYTIIGERPSGLDGHLHPKMDHLVCFMPGTIALGATGGLAEAEARKLPSWNKKKDDEMKLARELMQTCWGMYKAMATGLAAEITHFKIAEPPRPESAPHHPPADFDPNPQASWRQDFQIQPNDAHNLQRPETVESLLYMWRITGDVKYREWGWEMFESFVNYTAVEDGGGFTSLSNANTIPPLTKDNMESFWLAETLKYLYLLFSPNDLLPLDKVVFNTEAHPLPRFDLGRLFSTGWKRKPRDAHGNIVGKIESASA
ncbi:mannosyl-oligosaccharide 1,2-alpha-mannosidase [Metarhizium album ARSEF 1941]|uniref:alpha-1,2-Mannosidase n=1 Tax=Metarhizium album (strain ARSEF 1941) TaxID=1081103 RepID=A0A0B2WV10_METAS|nr:mannosyl-oligosaccharide 1,2-alpha-mannosidase [Metarhizium album ARSEF 1941]KHN99941.1 mannosyl-oligosaccharide 1,2-alpha-mannosidase [Metarhizium album ARSEF 1941]